LAKDVNGQQVCKEVDEEFLKNNLTSQYWEALLDHDKNKGCVAFSKEDKPQYYEESQLDELKMLTYNLSTPLLLMNETIQFWS
jgi:hypothetical protein